MSVISFKNQQLTSEIGARDLSSITQELIYGTSPIPDLDIREINSSIGYLYHSNNLVCVLDGGTPTGDYFSTPEVRVNAFWKMTDFSSDGFEFSKYQKFETPVDVVSFSPGRISIKITDDDQREVEESYRNLGVTKPDFGMLVVILNFYNTATFQRYESAFLIKYTHNPIFSTTRLLMPPVTITAKNVYKSPPYSSETFFIPTLSSSFVYNFFEQEESNYEIYNKRNYKNQRLDSIPKYIKLTWSKPAFNLSEFDRDNFVFPFRPDVPSSIRDAIRDSVEAGDIIPPPATGLLLDPSARREIQPVESIVSSDVIRIGGFIATRSGITSELGRHLLNPESRSGAEAIDTFDASTPTLPGGTAGVDIGPEERRQLGETSFVDVFGTYIPRETDVEFLIARNSDYIGYVIEKGRLTEDGEFSIIDIIAVEGKDATEYIDYKIAYGETYRYRIRSVFRFVNKKNLSMFSDSDSLITREQTVQNIDRNSLLQPNKTHYFDGEFSDPQEIQATESVRPNPPQNVRIFSKSKDKSIFITWNQKNQNRDVVGFNVYRKENKNGEQFLRLNSSQIDVRENFYIDRDVDYDVEYIYAVESIDFHGNFSKLSVQYSIKLKNVLSELFVCEFKQKFFEEEGRELGETSPPKKTSLIVFNKNFTLNVNPLFKETDQNNTFILKITSLDTGEQKEIKINFSTITIYHVAPYRPAENQAFSPFPGTLGFFDAETLELLRRSLGTR